MWLNMENIVTNDKFNVSVIVPESKWRRLEIRWNKEMGIYFNLFFFYSIQSTATYLSMLLY